MLFILNLHYYVTCLQKVIRILQRKHANHTSFWFTELTSLSFLKPVDFLWHLIQQIYVKYFHKTLQLHQVENSKFLPGMIGWRSWYNCGQMVDCRCVQGLSENFCWMMRSWQCRYRVLHQMRDHGWDNRIWNFPYDNHTGLVGLVSLVPSQAC